MKGVEVEKLAADIMRLIAERTPAESPVDAPRLLTARDVAERLQTNAQAVYRLARDGRLPAVVLGTRSYRWTEQVVTDFIARNGAQSQAVNTLRLVRSRA